MSPEVPPLHHVSIAGNHWLQHVAPALGGRPTTASSRRSSSHFSQRVPLSVRYQSLTSRDARRRTICPHHLVEDGNRLHARAWDYERQSFIDLVLTRMSDPNFDHAVPWIDGAADRDWNERIGIALEPNPSLSPGQAKVVMREIGLPPKGGRISVRRAEALYLLEHLGIRSAVQDGAENPAARIVCTNQVEVRETLCSR